VDKGKNLSNRTQLNSLYVFLNRMILSNHKMILCILLFVILDIFICFVSIFHFILIDMTHLTYDYMLYLDMAENFLKFFQTQRSEYFRTVLSNQVSRRFLFPLVGSILAFITNLPPLWSLIIISILFGHIELLFLYKIAEKVLNSHKGAFFSTMIFFSTSPIVFVFCRPITDNFANTFALIAVYYYLLMKESTKKEKLTIYSIIIVITLLLAIIAREVFVLLLAAYFFFPSDQDLKSYLITVCQFIIIAISVLLIIMNFFPQIFYEIVKGTGYSDFGSWKGVNGFFQWIERLFTIKMKNYNITDVVFSIFFSFFIHLLFIWRILLKEFRNCFISFWFLFYIFTFSLLWIGPLVARFWIPILCSSSILTIKKIESSNIENLHKDCISLLVILLQLSISIIRITY